MMTENELKRCREEFEVWVLNNFNIKPSQYTDDDVADFMKYRWNTWQAAWQHQQTTINALAEKLAKAVEALELIKEQEKYLGITHARDLVAQIAEIAQSALAEITKEDNDAK